MNSSTNDSDFKADDLSGSGAARDQRTRPTPVGFEQRLLARARSAGLGRDDRLVVGFSGGRDSLALAAGLRWTRDVLGAELLLVHVDHRLRDESGTEAGQAEELAERLGVRFRAMIAAATPTDIHPGVGLEEAARRERYRLLFAAAASIGAKAVVTGHHQQDQAETVLLHLMRGSGVRGAAGMREWSRAPSASAPKSDISLEVALEADSEGKRRNREWPWLWRPLLHEPRTAIEAYVGSIGLAWIEDPSNAELDVRRNVVRHEILPILEAWFPGASAALARYAELAGADDDALDQLAREALRGEVDPGGRMRAGLLGDHHPALQRRIVRRWLLDVTGFREHSSERIDAVVQLAFVGRGGRTAQVGGGWTVELREGMLSARRQRDGREGEG